MTQSITGEFEAILGATLSWPLPGLAGISEAGAHAEAGQSPLSCKKSGPPPGAARCNDVVKGMPL
jgi:hypothetical protein